MFDLVDFVPPRSKNNLIERGDRQSPSGAATNPVLPSIFRLARPTPRFANVIRCLKRDPAVGGGLIVMQRDVDVSLDLQLARAPKNWNCCWLQEMPNATVSSSRIRSVAGEIPCCAVMRCRIRQKRVDATEIPRPNCVRGPMERFRHSHLSLWWSACRIVKMM
jgi:hypothetical protein